MLTDIEPTYHVSENIAASASTAQVSLTPCVKPIIPPPPITTTYYINLDSRDRDRSIWPLSSQYEVKLDPPSDYTGASIQRHFKNVMSITLMNAVFPNTSNVLNAPPLFLNFPELTGNIETTNNGNQYFAKLLPSTLIGGYVYAYNELGNRSVKEFPFRGKRLDKLTVEFRDNSGAIFNFGTDTTSNLPANPLIQTSILLQIVVEVSNRD